MNTKNIYLDDNKISLKAKGLLTWMMNKPENYQFSIDRISKEVCRGTKSIRSGLQELERGGYLIRKLKDKDSNGLWSGYDYKFYPNNKITS